MIQQAKAKIFLADERGLNETAWFSSQNTFNFGKYFNEHKYPFGNIYVVNDDTLDAGCSLKMLIEENSHIVLLPVMGAITFNDSYGNKNTVAAGQTQVLTFDKGGTLEIRNPFNDGLVNFLQIWIRAAEIEEAKDNHLYTYNVNEHIDNLFKISPETEALHFTVSIGKFNGRSETVYHLTNKNTGVFVFVIEGAFEVQGRLLHARDGLALWETNEVEMEALSNDAIILVIETQLYSY